MAIICCWMRIEKQRWVPSSSQTVSMRDHFNSLLNISQLIQCWLESSPDVFNHKTFSLWLICHMHERLSPRLINSRMYTDKLQAESVFNSVFDKSSIPIDQKGYRIEKRCYWSYLLFIPSDGDLSIDRQYFVFFCVWLWSFRVLQRASYSVPSWNGWAG